MFTLQKYIEHIGVNELARQLNVEGTTVSHWKNFRSAPRPHMAFALIQKTGGLLTWEGIFQPFVDNNNEDQLNFLGDKG